MSALHFEIKVLEAIMKLREHTRRYSLKEMNSLTIELVKRDDPECMFKFLTFGESEEESMELLEESNKLITPVMNYMSECKSVLLSRRFR